MAIVGVGRLGHCSADGAMKAPVLVVADAAGARAIRAALAGDLDVTVTDQVTRARALASTGAFVCVFATRAFIESVAGTVELDPTAPAAEIASTAQAALASAAAARFEEARNDEVGAVPYDEYVELARYALIRRYLLALLAKHNGSVTDAAKGANMKRESLHRLMRRYHVTADDFRER
jgi:transcriptional regulator with GAF, ATPase, and Fis domain